MSDGFLSQEEIDSLLNGGSSSASSAEPSKEGLLSEIEKDLLGEIGNISMGSASTALSTIINQQVNITTPVVSITTLRELRDKFEVPNIALDVKYTSGIVGENILIMKLTDAGVIANLMMGGDGSVQPETLSEIEISAVSEAMNQMIGSAATSMATMLTREVNISPPDSTIWDNNTAQLSNNIPDDQEVVEVAFRLTIGELIDSQIMQVLPIQTAKKIVSIMMGEETEQQPSQQPAPVQQTAPVSAPVSSNNTPVESSPYNNYVYEKPIETNTPPVEVQRAAFQPLQDASAYAPPKNIDLILDVPLEISVVLGRTKKSIKDILNLGTGSLVELDKLAEEPVEILVNGKKVAYGEVVVVDENFGVRITSIVSGEERVKSLAK
ncbi:MAG: flagellar motor switch phosphatase FliY [Bacillota bacterium]|nr:flagellar motor switch phosphatase FliY [Bacillota bacterium]